MYNQIFALHRIKRSLESEVPADGVDLRLAVVVPRLQLQQPRLVLELSPQLHPCRARGGAR